MKKSFYFNRAAEVTDLDKNNKALPKFKTMSSHKSKQKNQAPNSPQRMVKKFLSTIISELDEDTKNVLANTLNNYKETKDKNGRSSFFSLRNMSNSFSSVGVKKKSQIS